MNINNIEETTKKHYKFLEDLIKSQNDLIETQEQLIQALRAEIKVTEISRDYWIDEYYKIAKELIKWIS